MTDNERQAAVHRVVHMGSSAVECEADARAVARTVETEFGYSAEVRCSDRGGWMVLSHGPMDRPPAA